MTVLSSRISAATAAAVPQEMARLGWTGADLSCRLKNDPGKLALAARVRRETTLPIRWIAARLQMGSPKSLRPMLYDWIHHNEQPATQAVPRKATCRQLQFEPLV